MNPAEYLYSVAYKLECLGASMYEAMDIGDIEDVQEIATEAGDILKNTGALDGLYLSLKEWRENNE